MIIETVSRGIAPVLDRTPFFEERFGHWAYLRNENFNIATSGI